MQWLRTLRNVFKQRDFYVNDLMTVTDVEDAVKLQKMISLLECAGMKLGKFRQNLFSNKLNSSMKKTILPSGMFWIPSKDKFLFQIQSNEEHRPLSKLNVLLNWQVCSIHQDYRDQQLKMPKFVCNNFGRRSQNGINS